MNAIMQNFDKIFNASLIYATFRSATPIIFAALCAAITQQANILNIGTEGIMLVGAFTAVAVSYFTGSWLLSVNTIIYDKDIPLMHTIVDAAKEAGISAVIAADSKYPPVSPSGKSPPA